jgi:hypothetical protein
LLKGGSSHHHLPGRMVSATTPSPAPLFLRSPLTAPLSGKSFPRAISKAPLWHVESCGTLAIVLPLLERSRIAAALSRCHLSQWATLPNISSLSMVASPFPHPTLMCRNWMEAFSDCCVLSPPWNTAAISEPPPLPLTRPLGMSPSFSSAPVGVPCYADALGSLIGTHCPPTSSWLVCYRSRPMCVFFLRGMSCAAQAAPRCCCGHVGLAAKAGPIAVWNRVASQAAARAMVGRAGCEAGLLRPNPAQCAGFILNSSFPF